MAVSLNSVTISFNPFVRRTCNKVKLGNAPFSVQRFNSTQFRHRFHPLASIDNNNNNNNSYNDTQTISEDKPSSNPPDAVSSENTSEALSNGAANATTASGSSSTVKKSSLTARERLRAARVLSRYTDSPAKPSKPPELGSRLLDALQETDKGKGKRRSGLPEAPTNLFDDSKRGMPKPGWTFDFPGGMDVFFIVISFVLISTLMFATTYIVWKVGAIHFNEY